MCRGEFRNRAAFCQAGDYKENQRLCFQVWSFLWNSWWNMQETWKDNPCITIFNAPEQLWNTRWKYSFRWCNAPSGSHTGGPQLIGNSEWTAWSAVSVDYSKVIYHWNFSDLRMTLIYYTFHQHMSNKATRQSVHFSGLSGVWHWDSGADTPPVFQERENCSVFHDFEA